MVQSGCVFKVECPVAFHFVGRMTGAQLFTLPRGSGIVCRDLVNRDGALLQPAVGSVRVCRLKRLVGRLKKAAHLL